jgi:hypothetical protein
MLRFFFVLSFMDIPRFLVFLARLFSHRGPSVAEIEFGSVLVASELC